MPIVHKQAQTLRAHLLGFDFDFDFALPDDAYEYLAAYFP